MKVACIFGTFDPIHNGHLMMATTCLNYDFDQVWFIPSYNPFKVGKEFITPYNIRYEMIKKGIIYGCNIFVNNIEMAMYHEFCERNVMNEGLFPGNYTYDVLNRLKEQFEDIDFSLVVGSDCFFDLYKWKNYEKLVGEYPIVWINRKEENKIYCYTDFINLIKLKMPRIDISSSMIREMIKNEDRITFYVPTEVEKYIKDNKLYN